MGAGKFKVQFCSYCIGSIITLMIFQYIVVVARVLVRVICQTGISGVHCFQLELVVDTFGLLVRCDLEQSKAFCCAKMHFGVCTNRRGPIVHLHLHKRPKHTPVCIDGLFYFV